MKEQDLLSVIPYSFLSINTNTNIETLFLIIKTYMALFLKKFIFKKII